MKEHDLNNSFNDIKRNLLENITYEKTNNKGFVQKDISYFCAYYTKKAEEHFNQERKEEIYKISLVKSLKVIAQDTDEELSLIYDLIYDEFGRNNFEKDLRDLI